MIVAIAGPSCRTCASAVRFSACVEPGGAHPLPRSRSGRTTGNALSRAGRQRVRQGLLAGCRMSSSSPVPCQLASSREERRVQRRVQPRELVVHGVETALLQLVDALLHAGASRLDALQCQIPRRIDSHRHVAADYGDLPVTVAQVARLSWSRALPIKSSRFLAAAIASYLMSNGTRPMRVRQSVFQWGVNTSSQSAAPKMFVRVRCQRFSLQLAGAPRPVPVQAPSAWPRRFCEGSCP